MTKILTKLVSTNMIIFIYGFASLGLELLSLIFFDCSPNIRHPFYPVLLWLTILLILSVSQSKRIKAIYSLFFLLIQCLIILASNYLFLSNGTVFERNMLKQRNDAYATIEQFYLTPMLVFLCAITVALYVGFLFIYLRKCKKKGALKIQYNKSHRSIAAVACILLLVSLKMIPMVKMDSNIDTGYDSILYKADNSYQNVGVTGNFIYEMLRGDKNTVDISDVSNLEASIYEKRCDTSIYNGISSGNNLIMILAESFEWYPLTMYSKEQTEELYPNLSRFMNSSIQCNKKRILRNL